MNNRPREKGAPQRTPLWARHREAGGKIVPFAGWEMPIRYTSILEEHEAVRSAARLFDVSHMGDIILTGADAIPETERITTARLSGKSAGFIQYALLLNEEAGILDDILVYLLDGRVMLVVNAVNRAKDLEWIRAHADGDVDVTDSSGEISQIAVQGRASEMILSRLAGDGFVDPGYYRSTKATIAGMETIVSRTGYTGEFGYEIYAPWDGAVAIWDACLAAGAGTGLKPVGLGARDSLRLEMAYCLYGKDIDETVNPVEAKLTWTVRGKKEEWIGKEAYREVKEKGTDRLLTGFLLGKKEIPRHGFDILHEGARVGVITSGGYSPTCRAGIALGYVNTAVATASEGFEVNIRGRRAPATPVRGSFVPSSVKGDEEDSK